jgi:hypothetical protein
MVNEMQSRMMRAAPTDAMVRANEVVCAMSAVKNRATSRVHRCKSIRRKRALTMTTRSHERSVFSAAINQEENAAR